MSLYYSEKANAGTFINSKGPETKVILMGDQRSNTNLAEICDAANNQAAAIFEQVTGEEDLFPFLPDETDTLEDE